MTTTTITRLAGNTQDGWIAHPNLVDMLTGKVASNLEVAIATAEQRLKVCTLKQRPAAQLHAALKVAGVARVTMAPGNRIGRDSAYGKRHARRVLAAAGA